jgi:hypothetical protein
VDERVATYVPLTQIQQRLSTLHANSTPTGVLGIAAKREGADWWPDFCRVCRGGLCGHSAQECTHTDLLTGVSCYFICTSKLTLCLRLYEFAAAGRWRWIEATERANTFVYTLGDVATYNRMLYVGLFWPIVCFPTVGESVAVSLGLACSLIHLPQ